MEVHNRNEIYNQYISKLCIDFILVDHGLCPDWSRGEHRRRRDCIYLIMSGEGEITINGKVYRPHKNNMVLLPRNSIVSLHSDNETCYNKYWCDFIMHFDGISLFDIIDFPYVIELKDTSRALELFNMLERLHLNTDAASAFMIKACLMELVALFLQYDDREQRRQPVMDDFERTITDYINLHIQEPLPVKKLASFMGFNERYFIGLFSKKIGTTPAKHVKIMRLEKAKHELLYTNDKIQLIIARIGYSNIQKFSKDFKQHTGYAPSEFRKKFKSKEFDKKH